MGYLYYWFDHNVCDSKKKIHLLTDKNHDITKCGVECDPEEMNRSIWKLPEIPICKHCLKSLGKEGMKKFEETVLKKNKEAEEKKKISAKEKTSKKIVNDIGLGEQKFDHVKKRHEDILEGKVESSEIEKNIAKICQKSQLERDKDPLSVKRLRYSGISGYRLPTNSSEEIIKKQLDRIAELKDSGFDGKRANEVADQELNLSCGLDMKALIGENDEDSDEFADFLKEETFAVRMTKLNKNIGEISTIAKDSLITAKEMLQETFDNWNKDENTDNDFQHFYQICQLKNLIKDLKSFCA